MTRLLLALAAVLLLPGAHTSAGQEPRALIRRAIEAKGGLENLSRCVAVRLRFKGTTGDDETSFTGEQLSEADLGRSRVCLEMRVGADRLTVLDILDGDKGWLKLGAELEATTDTKLDARRGRHHHYRVATLVPLLQENGFTFAPLEETTVAGHPAVGVRVSYPGQPDVGLYFDKISNLLVKSSTQTKAGPLLKETTEILYSGYREVDCAGADEQVLREVGVPVDGPALVAFLRKQVPDPAQTARAQALVRQLGAPEFRARERASNELVRLGAQALPLLRQAERSTDLEVARRAFACLRLVESRTGPAAVRAAGRLVGWRGPPGGTEALLDLLPGADEGVARAVRIALAERAEGKGGRDPVLARALSDKDPVRRAAAAAACGPEGAGLLRQPGRRLYLPGVKYPMKMTSYIDGRKDADYEVLAVDFFNGFEDKLFARP